TLPDRCQSSTIGADGLNCCVRDGNRCFPAAMVTEVSFCWSRRSALGKCAEHAISQLHAAASRGAEKCDRWSSPRPISTAQLKRLPVLHLRPINQLVSLGSYLVYPVGDLILRWASYLDAFSTYPIRT